MQRKMKGSMANDGVFVNGASNWIKPDKALAHATGITTEVWNSHVTVTAAFWHACCIIFARYFHVLDWKDPPASWVQPSVISDLHTSSCGNRKQELSGEQRTQMLLIECEFSWFTLGPVPSLDASVSLLFLYSKENDPCPWRWQASSYSDPSVSARVWTPAARHWSPPLKWSQNFYFHFASTWCPVT